MNTIALILVLKCLNCPWMAYSTLLRREQNETSNFDPWMKTKPFTICARTKKSPLVTTRASVLTVFDVLISEFASPTLAVMQTTPSGGSKRGNTARLRTPFLPPIPARWMMHNDGSFATGSPKKSTSDSDLTQMHSSHPTNLSSVFS